MGFKVIDAVDQDFSFLKDMDRLQLVYIKDDSTVLLTDKFIDNVPANNRWKKYSAFHPNAF